MLSQTTEQISGRGLVPKSLVLAVLYLACLALSGLLLLAFKDYYAKTWLNDVMGFLDVVSRIRHGQVLYRDFYFFYGPLVALIPALGVSLGFDGGAMFNFNAIIVAGLVLLLAVVTMARRLTLPAAILVFLFIWLLIAVPMGEGRPFDEISWGTFYNRQGWAALMVIMLFYVEPESVGPADKWIDAIILSVLVLFEVYTKITYGVVAFGFVVANTLVSKYNRSVSLRSMPMILAIAGLLEAAFPFHAAYWLNIREFASRAGGGSLGLQQLMSMMIANAGILVSCFGALIAVRVAGRIQVFDLLFILGSIVANVIIRAAIGDNNMGALVALIAVFPCLGELARRAQARSPATTAAPFDRAVRLVPAACLLLAVVFAATEVANRIVAWENYARKVAGADSRPLRVGTLPGSLPALANFLVYRDSQPNLFDLTADGAESTLAAVMQTRLTRSPGEMLTAEEYMRTIIEGTNLLRTVDYHDRTVFTFDMVNPFPYALDLPPSDSKYPQFWLVGPYTTDAALLPKPEALIGAPDFVMVPRLPFASAELRNLMALYGPYLRQNYERAKQSPHWELWMRKTAAAGGGAPPVNGEP